MTKLTVAALQLAFGEDTDANIRNVSDLVREAASKGAQVVLPPELFEGPYFCREEDEALFANAKPTAEHPSVLAMQALAAELQISIPTSFFEADGPHHYNSLAMIGPDGKVAGVYRKSHIPDGPGYEEKFYFRPGNTGFKVWPGPDRSTLGVGVCWDQWYPETARAMMLMGAEILFYPTAIGVGAARPRPRHVAAVAPRDGRPCGLQRRSHRRCEPHRHRVRPALLRPQLHLRRARRHARRVRRGGDRRARCRPSTCRQPRSTAPPSVSSATAGRSCTGA